MGKVARNLTGYPWVVAPNAAPRTGVQSSASLLAPENEQSAGLELRPVVE